MVIGVFWLYSCKSLVTGVIVVITTYEYVTSGSFGERVRRDVSNGRV